MPGAVPLSRGGSNGKGRTVRTRFKEGTEHGEAIPEMRPWREVGWIFKDGGALAIERQGDRVRMRSARVSHQRDE
jgi:hypothetical protein